MKIKLGRVTFFREETIRSILVVTRLTYVEGTGANPIKQKGLKNIIAYTLGSNLTKLFSSLTKNFSAFCC